MKNTQDIKIRLSLNLTNKLVGYDKLFNELAAIEAKHGVDSALAAKMRRKHLIGILHLYCNNGFSLEPTNSFRTPEQAQQIAMNRGEPPSPPSTPPAAAFDSDTNATVTAATETPSNLKNEFDPEFKSAAVLLPNGSMKFGNLIID